MVLSQCSKPGLPDCWTDFKRVTSLSKWVWCNIFFIKTCLKYEIVTELSLNELGGSPKFETQASGAGLKTGFRCSYLKADGWNGWKQYWFHLFTWHKQTLKVLDNFHSIPSKKSAVMPNNCSLSSLWRKIDSSVTINNWGFEIHLKAFALWDTSIWSRLKEICSITVLKLFFFLLSNLYLTIEYT